jgi:predicted aspartyl protease
MSEIKIYDDLGYKIMNHFNGKPLTSTPTGSIGHSDGEVISTSDKFIIKMTKTSSGVWKVPAILNGAIKSLLLFDTGASDVALPSYIVMTLRDSGTFKDSDIVGTETYKLANGSTVICSYFFLKELTLGDLTIKNVKAVILENVMSDPILGQNVISRIGTFKINASEGFIEIQK